jgi:hypothetical protein
MACFTAGCPFFPRQAVFVREADAGREGSLSPADDPIAERDQDIRDRR